MHGITAHCKKYYSTINIKKTKKVGASNIKIILAVRVGGARSFDILVAHGDQYCVCCVDPGETTIMVVRDLLCFTKKSKKKQFRGYFPGGSGVLRFCKLSRNFFLRPRRMTVPVHAIQP